MHLLLTTARVEGAGKRGPFVERALFTDEVSFVVARSHPLAAKKSITPADLVQYGIVTGDAPPAEIQWFVNAVFGRRRPRFTTTTFPLTEAVFDAARAGISPWGRKASTARNTRWPARTSLAGSK